METAKLFKNGQSQAVRLPKTYRFEGKDVYIKKIDGIVMLIPKNDVWRIFVSSLNKFSDDFLSKDRVQGEIENREMF
ncbi:MAG: AbrB/MazE/SpoVT family DNA-binding domain-containing protein [Spirochaetes bacterium]|nr:AbrB/MazE/SpoVT family DNA-binding domain-containing protein [Spirochaetota bacterium]